MENFEFFVPADILFGRNQEDNLPERLKGYGEENFNDIRRRQH